VKGQPVSYLDRALTNFHSASSLPLPSTGFLSLASRARSCAISCAISSSVFLRSFTLPDATSPNVGNSTALAVASPAASPLPFLDHGFSLGAAATLTPPLFFGAEAGAAAGAPAPAPAAAPAKKSGGVKVAAAPKENPWSKKGGDAAGGDAAANAAEFPTLGDVASGKVKLRKKTEDEIAQEIAQERAREAKDKKVVEGKGKEEAE